MSFALRLARAPAKIPANLAKFVSKQTFTVNIRQMSVLLQAMCLSKSPLQDEALCVHSPPPDEPTKTTKKNKAATDRLAAGPGGGQVPMHKFESMDGWIVTAEEAGWIAKGIAGLLWRDFNVLAARHGGYSVS